ncbi:MAG TPA: 4a-hydroxytetrahydrobiopterin dehydratase [Gemmatimonadaceae bacterium]
MRNTERPERLSDIAVQRGLGSLPGWARKGDVLSKTFQFETFPDGIAFVTRVAEAAETAQHHPDIDIRYTKVTCMLTTHDAGGITQNDLQMANEIEFAATQ